MASSGGDSWPHIKCKTGLHCRELKGIQLFTVDDFLSKAESDAFIKAAEKLGFKHQSSLGPSKGEAFRDNDRISLDNCALAEKLWKAGLSTLFKGVEVDGKVAIGLNSNIRFYRYRAGQRFGQHIDESVEIDGDTTEYTLLIYLNTGSKSSDAKCKKSAIKSTDNFHLLGGETVFYSDRNKVVAEVVPTAGMALLHLHGDNCMLHEARLVSKGVKYVLRSDVVFH